MAVESIYYKLRECIEDDCCHCIVTKRAFEENEDLEYFGYDDGCTHTECPTYKILEALEKYWKYVESPDRWEPGKENT